MPTSSEPIPDRAVWQRALHLTERLSQLRAAKTQIPFDAELAAENLALWRAHPPFDKDSFFVGWLASDGMTAEEFTRLLGTPAEKLRDNGSTPQWLKTLADVYSAEQELPQEARESWGDIRNSPIAGFLNLVEPLMVHARFELEARAQKLKRDHRDAPFAPAPAVHALLANLVPQLLALVGRTMVLELNIARLKGLLVGATPGERFANFTGKLRQRDVALGFLAEYPVLARRVVGCVERWLRFSAEFLEHLSSDWRQIAGVFDLGSECGLLAEAEGGAGDTHRGGRSVVITGFQGGSKLVYKPRSLAVDEHFQDFIQWVNERGASPPLRTLKVLDCGNHGWVEFIHAAGCRSEEEVVRFYERQGEYLAILYILEATDFHFENLLACGEHPVLVDLEALFHPWLRDIDIKQPDLRMVTLAKARSVLRIGLLPRRSWAHDDYIGMDLSGLGGAPGQLAESVLQWAGIGTDEMAAVRQPMQTPPGRNRPTIDGAEVEVQRYKDPIVAGFCRMYDLLQRHRGELLSDRGPLSQFAEDEVRVVARATRGYGVLLSQSLHPDYLRDALDRERLFDRLWTGIDDNSHLARLIPAERRDLLPGDIPIFTTRPASKDLFTSDGHKVEGFLGKTGMALSKEHVRGLSAEDRRSQVWFIGASLATLDLQADELKWAKYEPIESSSICGRTQLAPLLIKEACRIGDRLEELSLQDGSQVTWIGFDYKNKVWSLDALLEDLYSGSPGLILALAYLGSFGFGKYTELARRALATFRVRLEHTGTHIRAIGAFNGWGGITYMLSHLAALWRDRELIVYAHGLVDRLPELIDQDESLDAVGGCAGCIGALLALNAVAPAEKVLAAAVQCGDRLVAKAQQVEGGMAWFTNVETVKPITGFAHGAAGYALALLELAAQTGNQTYRDIALQAILYEHSQYYPEAGNWSENAGGLEPGTRRAIGPSMAWCYGAPGIGMARVAAIKHLEHPVVREDLDLAVQATLKRGPGSNHSLCHGDLGNLDFLLQASQATGSPELALSVDQLTNQIIASMKEYGWLCGVPLGVESPALMNGLAGICYGLLRLADPDRVPSVLTLSPPSIPVNKS